MKEPYGEGVASHTGPESCGRRRKAALEALTGVRTGWVLSLERVTPRAPTTSRRAEGNIGGAVIARSTPSPAGSETPRTYGNFSHGNWEIPCSARSDGRVEDGPRIEASWFRVPLDEKRSEGAPRPTGNTQSPILVRAGNRRVSQR